MRWPTLVAIVVVVVVIGAISYGILSSFGAFTPTTETLYSTNCGTSPLVLELYHQYFFEVGDYLIRYSLFYGQGKDMRELVEGNPRASFQPLPIGLGVPVRVWELPKPMKSPYQYINDFEYSGENVVNIIIGPTSLPLAEYNKIADCIQNNKDAINTALANLGAHIPARDQYQYFPQRLGGIAYIPLAEENNYYYESQKQFYAVASTTTQ